MGKAPRIVLQDTWLNIYSEFFEISDDENIRHYVEEKALIVSLRSKIERVKLLCNNLLVHYSQFNIDKLIESGYAFNYSESTYVESVDRVIRKLKNEEIKYNQLVAGVASQENGKPLTFAMFDEKISQIERAFKVAIDTTKISAQMYAVKLKEYRLYMSALAEKNQHDNEDDN